MEASQNSKRKTRIGAYNTGDDRISALPDEILCHILSYMSTEKATKSTLLSRRWKFVWTSLPIISFSDYTRRNDDNITVRFSEFIDRVLTLVDVSCTREFSLSCYHIPYEFSRVSRWIRDIFTPAIEKLNLNFSSNKWINGDLGMVELPPNLFTSKKLRDLRLSRNIRLTVPLPVNLASLKTLHLHSIRSLDEDSVKNLLVGCPVLEELVIVRVDDNINDLFIMSSSLKKFKLSTHNISLKSNENYSLIVDAINLEEITLLFNQPKKFEARNFSSLVRANLDNCKIGMDTTADILRTISNVNHLRLSLDYSPDFAKNHDLPRFRNLASLKVLTNGESWLILQRIIESSPNLISLYYLSMKASKSYYNGNDRFKEIDTPKNVMFYLEKIVLNGFHGRGDEMEMIAYFLKNFPALKTISLYGFTDQKVRDKIFMLPKVSGDCEIIFSQSIFCDNIIW